MSATQTKKTAAEKTTAEAERAQLPTTTATTAAAANLSPTAFLDEDLNQFAGAGVSTDAEDSNVPYLLVLQKGSPQVNRQDPGFVRGAEAGDIYNTVTGRIYKCNGPDAPGVLVMPIWFEKREVEWVPRDAGGGYVATHSMDTSLLAIVKDVLKPSGKGSTRMIGNTGHQMVRTNYHFVIDIENADVSLIAASSSAIGFSRRWTGLMKAKKVSTKNGPVIAPSFSSVYRIMTIYNKNDQGDWYTMSAEDTGWVDTNNPTQMACYRAAKEFFLNAREHGVQLGRPPAMAEETSNHTIDADMDADEGPL